MLARPFARISTDVGSLSCCIPWSLFIEADLYPARPGEPAEVHLFSQDRQFNDAARDQAGRGLPDQIVSINVDRFVDAGQVIREPRWSAVVAAIQQRLAWSTGEQSHRPPAAEASTDVPGDPLAEFIEIDSSQAASEAGREAEQRRRLSRKFRELIVAAGELRRRLAKLDGFEQSIEAVRTDQAATAARVAAIGRPIPRIEAIERAVALLGTQIASLSGCVATGFEVSAAAWSAEPFGAPLSGSRCEKCAAAASVLGRLASELQERPREPIDESTLAQGAAAVREPIDDVHRGQK